MLSSAAPPRGGAAGGAGGGAGGGGGGRQSLNILDRPLPRSRLDVPQVSLSSYAYLFGELISYSMDRAASITELEERLERVGHDVGRRAIELLGFRERAPRRRTDVLDVLKHIHSAAWPYLFGKPADDLQQANAADDEFMITDRDPLVARFISVPKGYASFVPGAIVAGMVRGMLDGAGFPARVSAHLVDAPGGGRPSTTILIKFDPEVMRRQAQLDAGVRRS